MSTPFRLNTKLITSLSNVLFMPPGDIMAATTIPSSTWYRIMSAPESITIQQLLLISNGLHIPVRRLFSTGRTDIIGRKEDYIAEPYKECYYDSEAFQDIVNTSNEATWKMASEFTGVTRYRLRNSILSITRTPVQRFLAVCTAFDVEPFTILADPNPELKHKERKQGGISNDFVSELSELRSQITNLSKAVDNLTSKYKDLLDAHKFLLKRINDHLDKHNNWLNNETIADSEQ